MRMYNSFYRKVAFGLSADENIPSDPLEWAQSQFTTVPKFSWKGKAITSFRILFEFFKLYFLQFL